jgi:hypothetical protein
MYEHTYVFMFFYNTKVKKNPHRFSAMGVGGFHPSSSIQVGDWEGGGGVELDELLVKPQVRRNVSPFDSDSTVSTFVLAGAKGAEVADRKGLATVLSRLADVGKALSDALGPDLCGIRSAHHQDAIIRLGEEADPDRGSSLDSSEEGSERGSSFWSTIDPTT